jgi:holo-[acyl-carrier protein] synthase
LLLRVVFVRERVMTGAMSSRERDRQRPRMPKFNYRYNFTDPQSPPLAAEGRGSLIVGMGVDIAEIDRIETAIQRNGRRFIERLFTAQEIDYCERHKNPFERFAARFAVKEAAMKALGTGWRRGVRWLDIEVTNLPGGRPTVRLSGVAGEFAAKMGVKNISISITHSGNFALAQVIFEN